MSRGGVLILFLIVIGVAAWFMFANDGKFTGFATVEQKYPDMVYLGTFYDAGKGNTYASDYDVFMDGVSKGHFDSALEACKLFFPKSEKVWETSVAGEKESFSSRSGKRSVRDSYANYCYG